jgi:hypothetical protein
MYGMQNGPMKKTEEDYRMAQMKHKETKRERKTWQSHLRTFPDVPH